MNETEIISYHGVGNIGSASFILGKHLKEKYKNCTIILHRDKDYLTKTDLDILRTKIEKKDIHFFVTIGTDIESTFLNINHLHSITKIPKDELEKMLEESIDENEKNSLGRFINYSMINLTKEQMQLSNKGSHFQLQEQLRREYYTNKKDYMYGKKVFGVLKSKIQHKQGKNPDLIQKSEYILSEQLTNLCKKIWQNT